MSKTLNPVPQATSLLTGCLVAAGLWIVPGSGFAQTAAEDVDPPEQAEQTVKQTEADKKILERITVVGSEENVDTVPGSAYLLTGEKLEAAKAGFDDINRILRSVPGVNIQEEDGYGLRPNIGFRGTPTERSDSITLMEDGVLIAPAPYAAPAAYYSPTAGRMSGVEVLKGASQVKYGPRTIGGSLNYLSTPIPTEMGVKGQLGVGTDSTKKINVATGNSYKYGGWLAETYQQETNGFKELDGGGDTGFELEDYIGKIRLNTDPDAPFYQQLEVKLGDYKQDANETYLGLTEEDFNSNPLRRYSASQLDNITVDHRQYQAQHYVELSESLDVTTTGYINETDRNWYKLESVGGESISEILDNPEEFAEQLSFIRGGDSPDDALTLRANNRRYDSRGIQTVLAAKAETGDVAHALEFGVRFHTDEENRFQQEDKYRMDTGTLVLTKPGDPGSQANRIASADAWAFYVQDALKFEKLTVTPGVRYERIDLEIENFGAADPDRTGADLKRSESEVNAVVPGIGAHYQFTDEVGGFVGVHKGFSPPGPSTDTDIDEEESINYELGANYNKQSFTSELVLFYVDYENLLGAETLASGGDGSGDLFNAGEATVYGVEAALRYDLAEELELPVRLPWYASYTFTSAEFDSNFDGTFFGDVQSGDDIPYIPENQLATGIAVEHENLGTIGIASHYVQAMPTAAGEGNAGGGPKTDSYFVFDAHAETPLVDKVKLFVDVLNIFDEEYVVARRPAGARPGLPVTGLVGVKFDL